MRKYKRITTIILTFILSISTAFGIAGCKVGLRLYENEYFIYTISYDEPEVSILGLTDIGKQQEFLVIPENIDEKKVTAIGCSSGLDVDAIRKQYGNDKYSQFQSERLKRIYIISDIKVIERAWCVDYICDNAPALEAMLYISNTDKSIPYGVKSIGYDLYCSKLKAPPIAGQICHAANVSYYYNYENSPNENYYWIDDYDYGNRIEFIPEDPVREGYIFGGWYKEEKCENIWNFEADTLPEAKFDEEDQEIYQETKLFAKWIKN